jgi:hypothetical protein
MNYRTKAPAVFMGLATLVMAILTVVRSAMADQHVSAEEWVLVSIAGWNTATVWGAANIPVFAKAKTFMAAIGVTLALLVSLISGGLTVDEIILLVIEFLGAMGVVVGAQPPPSASQQSLASSRR